MVVIVMGVSGVGKTTIGRLLAERLGYEFAEGDDFHSAASVEKMRSGVPLDDADRRPWLDALRRQISAWLSEGREVVLACSALKRSYRARLKNGAAEVRIVYLHAPQDVIAARLRGRQGHFMPAKLLESQLETLEAPGRDEDVLTVDAVGEPAEVVERIVARLSLE